MDKDKVILPKLIYLATPYSHTNRIEENVRYSLVTRTAAVLFTKGYHVFSPITHCHPIKDQGIVLNLPLDGGFKYWREYNLRMLVYCDELWVLTLPGWAESKGVQDEILFAHNSSKPILYLEPYTYTAHAEARPQSTT